MITNVLFIFIFLCINKMKRNKPKLTNVSILDVLRQKFGNVLPHGYNIFIHQENTQYILYINDREVPRDAVSRAIGYISFNIGFAEQEIDIMFVLSTLPKNGIGHYLMFLVAFVGKIFNIDKILLDDDSDLAHRGSLYEKLGCNYINESPNPEMECSASKILLKRGSFETKYMGPGMFFK